MFVTIVDAACQLPVYNYDLKFEMQLQHYELYGVCDSRGCRMSISSLPDLNLVSTFEKISSAKTLKLLMGTI